MEDFLMLLLQALGEILFELFAYWPWDCWWTGSEWDRNKDLNSGWTATFLSIGMGALLGWASLYVFPAVLVKWAWLRVTLLFVSPLASGFMSREMARWRQERNGLAEPNVHFWIGLGFSVGFVWVRFALAHRPS